MGSHYVYKIIHKDCIVGDNFSNEALLVEIYVGAAFNYLSSNIPILIDGVSLTGNKFNRSHLFVLYQYGTLIVRQ
jgi:hypothetical protein